MAAEVGGRVPRPAAVGTIGKVADGGRVPSGRVPRPAADGKCGRVPRLVLTNVTCPGWQSVVGCPDHSQVVQCPDYLQMMALRSPGPQY